MSYREGGEGRGEERGLLPEAGGTGTTFIVCHGFCVHVWQNHESLCCRRCGDGCEMQWLRVPFGVLSVSTGLRVRNYSDKPPLSP